MITRDIYTANTLDHALQALARAIDADDEYALARALDWAEAEHEKAAHAITVARAFQAAFLSTHGSGVGAPGRDEADALYKLLGQSPDLAE